MGPLGRCAVPGDLRPAGAVPALRLLRRLCQACEHELARVGRPCWVPSVGDVMKARVRTSGIVEEKYTIDGVNFRMYDVGGQRNERKKWIHCFDGVTAIIFVGAISEYDQVLYEDKTQIRLVEAIELFDEI